MCSVTLITSASEDFQESRETIEFVVLPYFQVNLMLPLINKPAISDIHHTVASTISRSMHSLQQVVLKVCMSSLEAWQPLARAVHLEWASRPEAIHSAM